MGRSGTFAALFLGFAAIGVCIVLAGCGENKESKEVQRVLVRATSTTTPRPEKGKRPKPKVSPTKSQEKNAQQVAPTSPAPTKPQPSPVAQVTMKSATPMPSPSAKTTMIFVTSHSFGKILPNKECDYRIEGRGLAECRVYLRRHTLEVELVPTVRTDTKIEFARMTLSFLVSGEYDLVLREPAGREIVLARAARVP